MSDRAPLRIAYEYPLLDAELAQLRDSLRRHHVLIYDPDIETSPGDSAPFAVRDAEIIYGQPEPALLRSAPHLRWVQLSSAGYTAYDNDELRGHFRRRGIILTNSSHVYDEPCAQHLAAMILSLARDLPWCLDNQRSARDWPDHRERSRRTRLLNGQTVLIYGFGTIARRLVEILTPLNMRLIGVRRSVRGDEGIPMLTENDADAMLGDADHVVDILPASSATRAFFDAGRFARFKRGARFYNIGRGATVDQDALMAALHERSRLNAAYVDVTDPEPLPPSHPLWSAANCYITPHFGGGFSDEVKRLTGHFLTNLELFEEGKALHDRVY